MPTTLPNKVYKYNVGGQTYYEVLPATNTPTGHTEIDPATAQNEIQALISQAQSGKLSGFSAEQQQPMAGFYQKSLDTIKNMNPDSGVIPSYVTPWGETLTNTNQAAIDSINANEAAVKAGTMKMINPGVYIPVGSAADQQLKNPVAPQPTGPQPNATATPNVQFPTIALQPGSTDIVSVKQLQDYLVSKGYMTQEQVNTGYGTYGPQTTAAVKALQEALKVDNSSGVGYWGPKTLAAVQGTTGANNGSGVGSGTGSGVGTGGTAPIAPNPPASSSPIDFGTKYTENLTSTGATTVKPLIDKVIKDFADLQNELNDKISEVSSNPWLSEGLRSKEITSLQNKYQGKLDILTNQQKLYESLYQEAVAQAQFLTTGEVKQQVDLAKIAQDKADALAKLNSDIVETGGHKWLVTYDSTGMIKSKQDLGVASTTTSTTDSKKAQDWINARQFLKDNPKATYAQLESGLREHTTTLSDVDIKSLLTGTGVSSSNLTRQKVSSLYGIPDNNEKSGIDWWKQAYGSGETNAQKLDDIMNTIKKYQDVGYTDDEILKLVNS